jgi:hypothetical protein
MLLQFMQEALPYTPHAHHALKAGKLLVVVHEALEKHMRRARAGQIWFALIFWENLF